MPANLLMLGVPLVLKSARAGVSTWLTAAVVAALLGATSTMAGEAAPARQADVNSSIEPPLANYNCGLADFTVAMLKRINNYRSAGFNCRTSGTFEKTTPLVWNTTLLKAAIEHSRYMAANKYFAHTSAEGRTSKMRITDAGYTPWRAIGENIAVGYEDVNSVVDSWMESDRHCANIMAPTFSDVGVACYNASGDSNGNYWTMDLGKLR